MCAKIQRAPQSDAFEKIQPTLRQLIPILEDQDGWYGSVLLERRRTRNLSANLQQTGISDEETQGIVLRIYDGRTLHEQATDDLELSNLEKLARKFAARVAKLADQAQAGPCRPYSPPSWSERLAPQDGVPLDPEITSQLPSNLAADFPVHFGIRYDIDPVDVDVPSRLARLQARVERVRQLAPSVGLAATDVSFAVSRETVGDEESIFVDRESNMSQRIFRVALTVAILSGSDRVITRFGGLGGYETVDFYSDEQLLEMLRDLKALKIAERLKPGRYRLLCGPEVTGVLAHEAFGHSQEGDTCARGRSKAWELYQSGQVVGNQHATILNNPAAFQNGSAPGAAWGTYFFDEEGWLAREQLLLKEGVLQRPMTNLVSSIRLGVPRSANGKRENWSHGVYVRQTNTYFSAGERTFSELLGQVSYGFLATSPAGGMEDPKGMGIQVGVQYLKEIKDGKFTGKIFRGPAGGDIQLTGYVPDLLHSIIDKSKIEADSVQPDHARHPYNDAGGCGKYHKEWVHAGCGGTYLLLDQAILG